MIIDIDPKEIVEKRINPANGLQPDTEERKPRQALKSAPWRSRCILAPFPWLAHLYFLDSPGPPAKV